MKGFYVNTGEEVCLEHGEYYIVHCNHSPVGERMWWDAVSCLFTDGSAIITMNDVLWVIEIPTLEDLQGG